MAKLNSQLVWLAQQVGIKDVKRFASDAVLAGAVYAHFTTRVELMNEELGKMNVRLDKIEGKVAPKFIEPDAKILAVENAWDILKAAKNKTDVIDALVIIRRLILKLDEPMQDRWERHVGKWLRECNKNNETA